MCCIDLDLFALSRVLVLDSAPRALSGEEARAREGRVSEDWFRLFKCFWSKTTGTASKLWTDKLGKSPTTAINQLLDFILLYSESAADLLKIPLPTTQLCNHQGLAYSDVALWTKTTGTATKLWTDKLGKSPLAATRNWHFYFMFKENDNSSKLNIPQQRSAQAQLYSNQGLV